MTKKPIERPGFREWVDKQADPGWSLLPLTHMTKGIGAEDIIRQGVVEINPEDVSLGSPVSYFFYGRPAYRVDGDGALKVEAACPFCFVFKPELINSAKTIFAFDTGAFNKRLYKHIILEEMQVSDFSLEKDCTRPNKIIASVFGAHQGYYDGIVRANADVAEAWEFHAKTYLQLITSPGRNEPDDRVFSIEVTFDAPVKIEKNLMAVFVPHTLWEGNKRAPWLNQLETDGVDVRPYIFVPGRHPAHYQTLLEAEVRDYYEARKIL